jgi:hypothetical protein
MEKMRRSGCSIKITPKKKRLGLPYPSKCSQGLFETYGEKGYAERRYKVRERTSGAGGMGVTRMKYGLWRPFSVRYGLMRASLNRFTLQRRFN